MKRLVMCSLFSGGMILLATKLYYASSDEQTRAPSSLTVLNTTAQSEVFDSDVIDSGDLSFATVPYADDKRVEEHGHLLAPESNSLEEYFAYIDNHSSSEKVNPSLNSDEVDFDYFDMDITLWHSLNMSKSAFENYDMPVSLDEQHLIEFDESVFEHFAVGLRFTSPKLGQESRQFIVKQQDSWDNGATNWQLINNQGHPAGSLTQTQDGVEGIFVTPDGIYHLSTHNGIGWVADEQTLIDVIEPVFTRGSNQ